MSRSDDLPESKLENVWSPQQLAETSGYSRQTIIDAIKGKGRYPRRLFAQKVGTIWLIPDDHAAVFLHWTRTGEVLQEPPEPEKIYWSVGEIVERSGMSVTTVEVAITGVKGKKYSYPPRLAAQRLGQYWLVKSREAEQYIQEKRKNRNLEKG